MPTEADDTEAPERGFPPGLLRVVATIRKVNPGMFDALGVLLDRPLKPGVPQRVSLKPRNKLKAKATKAKEKPKFDLLADSKARQAIKPRGRSPKPSIFAGRGARALDNTAPREAASRSSIFGENRARSFGARAAAVVAPATAPTQPTTTTENADNDGNDNDGEGDE
jgi:hypothetical protein